MTTNDITVKVIFKSLNLNAIAHSYGGGRTLIDDSASTSSARSILNYLPEDSLASKIVRGTSYFSTKQQWVIAYELMKSEAYKAALVAELKETYGDDVEMEDIDYMFE